jgi:hypothetical protein
MSNIGPRYAAFQKIGGGKNHEYATFIGLMKVAYIRSTGYTGAHPGLQSIRDHDDFTRFINRYVEAQL